MAEKRKYDSTVARIAGNIASGLASTILNSPNITLGSIAHDCVELAREIVAETERTEPLPSPPQIAPTKDKNDGD